ncbi:MAG TPA: hypothetical protein VFF19_19055 [Reyranella sp.]|nr:hypothetical protein [Reyranella sp.]
MDSTRRLDFPDAALLAAFVLIAVLGTWQKCLLVNDGAVYLAAAWLGNAWDLFYSQNTGRVVSTLLQFGPAWLVRPLFGGDALAFIAAAHALYFAIPLGLWLIVRAVEPQRMYSRLYLAVVLVLIQFTSEMVQGIGLWMIWLALMADPARSSRVKAIASAVMAAILALTHPAIALLSLAFGACGIGLLLLRRPFPRPLAIAALAMGAFLTVVYLATAPMWAPSNPTIAAQHTGARFDYVDPLWMFATLGLFPLLASLWLLMLAPGLESTAARWRLSRTAVLVVGAIGLWFAVSGTNILTWIFARQTAPYVLALALALALASPARAWFDAARRALAVFAVLMAVASTSYTVDLALFARAAEARLAPLEAGDSTPRFVEFGRSPSPAVGTVIRGTFKWAGGEDYVRDVVVPDYGGQRMTFAFYTFFQSNRRVVLFPALDRSGEWVPFECAPVDRALAKPYDAVDARMLRFIRERYCVP